MSCTTRREESRSAKAFRAFLALYPAAFRDEYGRELSLLFVDRYRDATGPSGSRDPLARCTHWTGC